MSTAEAGNLRRQGSPGGNGRILPEMIRKKGTGKSFRSCHAGVCLRIKRWERGSGSRSAAERRSKMENRQKERTRIELDQKELEKVNGGVLPIKPDDDDRGSGNDNGGGATGGW